MSLDRLRAIVALAVPALFRQIGGGRVLCESEATFQLHLGRVIAAIGDLELIHPRETFAIELEKPLRSEGAKRGRLDIWFSLSDRHGRDWRCAAELKFFKKVNQREPRNRYDVFADIARLERCGDVADLGYMLVASDHPHYRSWAAYSPSTSDFDFRDGQVYTAGTRLTYHNEGYGDPIILARDYDFRWTHGSAELHYLLLEITPMPPS